MSESWFASKENKDEAVDIETPVNEEPTAENSKAKTKRGFSLFRAKAKSPDTAKKGGFSLFKKKPEEPPPNEESEEEEPESPKKGGVFSFFSKKPVESAQDEGLEEDEDEAAKTPKKGMFNFFGGKSGTDQEGSDLEEKAVESEVVVEEEVELEEEIEDEEENGSNFEDSMRNVLRKLGVEVEDEDDWKEMVIKTRLTLKAFKDSLIGNEGTKEERTKRLIVVINEDNVLELQFRLDFAHYTPPNLDIEDEDEIEIKPDLTGLETPVNPEKPAVKKKRLKRIIKAITKAQKLNKKRLKRLEEKQLIKAQEEKAKEAEELKALAEEARVKAEEEARVKAEEEAKAKEQEFEDKTEDRVTDVFEDEESEETENPVEEKEGEEGEEGEEEDEQSILGKIEDQTGIRIIIRTDGLEKRLNEQVFVPLQEYKEIFFGPDLTEEEKEELEKIANDEKEFYIHLKLLCRKKTWEEKEAERIAAEEEAKRKEEEEKAAAAEAEDADIEAVVFEETDEKKREKRKELEEKQKEGGSESEAESEISSIDYGDVPIV